MNLCRPLAALVCLATTAAAATEAPVENVLITARVPPPVGSEAFSGALIPEENLRLAPQLDAALSQVPGLSLFRRNSSVSANPTTQGVSLRSIAPSGAGRALVTLDGVPQNDPFGFWVIWSALPPEALASAEIVRGAGAGPYGAGALTGVVALTEREDNRLIADGFWGERETGRAAVAGGMGGAPLHFFGNAAVQTSGGWIPVDESQRGAADDEVTLDARSASLRVQANPFAAATAVARVAWYDEERNSGLVGAASSASGIAASLTLAHPQAGDMLGWRLQGWIRDTDFTNSSVAVAAGRVSTTPSNNQYETPALGWGINAAIRDSAPIFDWEIGVDARSADGESREHFQFVSGDFAQNRAAGGKNFVGGLYGELARRSDAWLFTLGARVDYWKSSDGHLIQNLRATGAVTLEEHYPEADGTVPTARAGIRRELGEGLFLRGAGYSGFRPPSLNELYRPFRLGNNITIANPALEPERLYGGELGGGDDEGALAWSVTGFYNRLDKPIANVTIGQGPGTFPGAGFVPAGGLLIQRQNAGAIKAWGFEAEAHYDFTGWLGADAAVALVDAQVDGGTTLPHLTGRRPVQTPRFTLTAGLTANPVEPLGLELRLRHESVRFADDQNRLRLPPLTRVDARVSWQILPALAAYVAADNLFDEQTATTMGADGVVSYDAPRWFRVGLTFLGE
jgi:outer membrane receptor protein involved in Fe transport